NLAIGLLLRSEARLLAVRLVGCSHRPAAGKRQSRDKQRRSANVLFRRESTQKLQRQVYRGNAFDVHAQRERSWRRQNRGRSHLQFRREPEVYLPDHGEVATSRKFGPDTWML